MRSRDAVKWHCRGYIALQLPPRHVFWRKTAQHCFYCDRVPPLQERQLDHLTPVVRGGTHEEGNIVPCCRACNRRKNDQTLDEFRTTQGLQHFPGERRMPHAPAP